MPVLTYQEYEKIKSDKQALNIKPAVSNEKEKKEEKENDTKTYYLLHPDNPSNNYLEFSDSIIIDDKEYIRECRNGIIKTDKIILKDYLLKKGYELLHVKEKKTMSDQTISAADARNINNLSPGMQVHGIGSKLRNALALGIGFKEAQKYYVDGTNGDDSNDGLSWDTAFATIQKGVNTARYLPGTTTIDSTKDRDKYVFIFPGQYNEQVLFSGYNIHIIGMGDSGVGGGDYGVVLNYDDAIAATGVLGATGVNIEIANLTFNTTQAIPGVAIPSTSDGIHIHNCLFKGADTKTPTKGIDGPSLKGCLIEDNVIHGFITGIDLGHAAGQWCYLNIVRNNHVVDTTNGIKIASGAVGLPYTKVQGNTVLGSTASIINSQASDVIITENRTKPAISDAGSAAGDNTTLA